MLIDGPACVLDCGTKKTEVNGTCVPCNGQCPKGIMLSHALPRSRTVVAASTVMLFIL